MQQYLDYPLTFQHPLYLCRDDLLSSTECLLKTNSLDLLERLTLHNIILSLLLPTVWGIVQGRVSLVASQSVIGLGLNALHRIQLKKQARK